MSKGRSLKEGEADSICDIVAFKISKGEGLGSKELYINGVCAFRQKNFKKYASQGVYVKNPMVQHCNCIN